MTIFTEINDGRAIGAVKGQLGTLAMLQGNLPQAAQFHHEALNSFQQLNQPAMEAVAWHQLGIVYEKAKKLDAAEQAYREAAHIHESLGNLTSASQTWNQLAAVTQSSSSCRCRSSRSQERARTNNGRNGEMWLGQ